MLKNHLFFKNYNKLLLKVYLTLINLYFNIFRLEKGTKGIKDKILRDIKYLFEEYYKPVRINNF